MKLAFWKSKPARRSGAAAPDTEPALDDTDDEARLARLRVRARRRLVGAAALLLAVVIVVPMVLDPTPHPLPDNIPIDLPSDRTSFTPKLAPPPVEAAPAPGAAGEPVPAAPGSAADAGATEAPAAAAARPAGEGARTAAQRPTRRAEAGAAQIYVQAAALSKESAARDLAGRLGKSGLTPFVERIENNGATRYRVRLGPFATRDEAEHARARLHALGVSSNIVGAG